MIGFQIFSSIPTSLDLNGPTLSFLEQPVGITTIESTASFTGIVTSTPVGTGHLSYQWYEVDRGKVIPTDFVTGAASTGPIGAATTLTVTNLITPGDNQRKFYVQAD